MNLLAIISALITITLALIFQDYALSHLSALTPTIYRGFLVVIMFLFPIYVAKYETGSEEYNIPFKTCMKWLFELLFLSGGTAVLILSVYFVNDIHDIFWLSFGGYTVATLIKIFTRKKKTLDISGNDN